VTIYRIQWRASFRDGQNQRVMRTVVTYRDDWKQAIAFLVDQIKNPHVEDVEMYQGDIAKWEFVDDPIKKGKVI